MTLDVKHIIEFWVKKSDYDGLYSDIYDGCGCGGEYFMPDDDCPRQDCVPAYKHICPGPGDDSECDSEKGETCYRPTKEPCEGK